MLQLKRDQDTICSLATAPGAGAVAIVRLSGDKAEAIIKKIAPFLPEQLESHKIYYGILRDPVNKEMLDEVLVSYFQKGKSYTGEATFEISCHGGTAISALLVKKLIENGARQSERGEFTYRAFMNGRIDLVQAESVLSLVNAESELVAKAALRQLRGHLSKSILKIQDDLSWALARLEANLDFSSEFIEFAKQDEIVGRVQSALLEIQNLSNSYAAGKILSQGFRIAIAGAPNVGKSSLLNKILGEERAIVTPIAGTTRDCVSGDLMILGKKVTFIDTAGLRETDDVIEQIGMTKTTAAMSDADIVLFVYDRSRPETRLDHSQYLSQISTPMYFVGNKSDLIAGGGNLYPQDILISTQANLGIEPLMGFISNQLAERSSDTSTIVLHGRQYEALNEMLAHAARGLNLLKENVSPEFVISELQVAYRQALLLLGQEFDDQILDRVFNEFCLGK